MQLSEIQLERVYHPWDTWEEVAHNMWGDVDDKKVYLKHAIKFTGDHKRYGRFMMRVVEEWPVSCENALTDPAINKKAWVGHAACALALECPEHITREAWSHLTDEQQLLANEKAQHAIDAWKMRYAQSKGLLPDVGEEMLL